MLIYMINMFQTHTYLSYIYQMNLFDNLLGWYCADTVCVSAGRASSRGVREKERSVPIRPFQKLPPPFDLNEHHNMHKSLKIPIAIYEKEPTSLIAYALSSREYAQEYWALVERRPVAIQPPEKLLPQPSSPKV